MEFDNIDINRNDITHGQFLKIIESTISTILKKTFSTDFTKQQIVHKNNRIVFSCPICGDSKKNSSKKRGNIYTKRRFLYVCYNECGSMSLLSLFRRTNTELPIDESILNDLSSMDISLSPSGHRSISSPIYDYYNKLVEIDKYAIPSDIIEKLYYLKPIDQDDRAKEFLSKRNQLPYSNRLRANKFGIYIFNSTHGGKVIGFQIRFYSGKLRYMSVNYSKILFEKLGVNPSDVDEKIVYMMDKLSNYYNIFDVDFNKPVNIFEGAFNSHHMSNSIASLSATNPINFRNARYFYDNDATGIKKAIEKLDHGYEVFLWSAIIKDLNLFGKKINDLDDLMKIKPITEQFLLNYFSKDSLSIIDI